MGDSKCSHWGRLVGRAHMLGWHHTDSPGVGCDLPQLHCLLSVVMFDRWNLRSVWPPGMVLLNAEINSTNGIFAQGPGESRCWRMYSSPMLTASSTDLCTIGTAGGPAVVLWLPPAETTPASQGFLWPQSSRQQACSYLVCSWMISVGPGLLWHIWNEGSSHSSTDLLKTWVKMGRAVQYKSKGGVPSGSGAFLGFSLLKSWQTHPWPILTAGPWLLKAESGDQGKQTVDWCQNQRG